MNALHRLKAGAAGRIAALRRLLERGAFRPRAPRQEARRIESLAERAIARLPDPGALTLAGLLIGKGAIAVEGRRARAAAATRKAEAVARQDAHDIAGLHRAGRDRGWRFADARSGRRIIDPCRARAAGRQQEGRESNAGKGLETRGPHHIPSAMTTTREPTGARR